jgi:hypothetical protein
METGWPAPQSLPARPLRSDILDSAFRLFGKRLEEITLRLPILTLEHPFKPFILLYLDVYITTLNERF